MRHLITALITITALEGLPAHGVSAAPLAKAMEVATFTLPDKEIGGRVTLAAGPDGQTLLAWMDSGHTAQIALLGAGSAPSLRVVTSLSNRRLNDVVARPDGFAVLSGSASEKSEPGGFLTSFDWSGRQLFDARVGGPWTRQAKAVGDQQYWGGSLAWSGQAYAAYFNVLQLYGDGAVHQGDGLALLDGQGRPIKGGWRWGVSHSFGVRSAFDGKRFVTATVGDANPRGLVIDRHAETGAREPRIFFPATGVRGDNTVPVVMGELVAANQGAAVAFIDDDDRGFWGLHDVGLVVVRPDGTHSEKLWITETDEVNERQARLAVYGENLFVTYAIDDKPHPTHFVGVVVDWQGHIIDGPEALDMNRDTDRLVTYPNGDVGWLAGDNAGRKGPRTLRLYRLHVQ